MSSITVDELRKLTKHLESDIAHEVSVLVEEFKLLTGGISPGSIYIELIDNMEIGSKYCEKIVGRTRVDIDLKST